MAVVPWIYSDPRVDRSLLRKQHFTLCGKNIIVTQDTDAEINVTKNTALKLWDGAYLLAKHLENESQFTSTYWENRKCLELGAGCGLAGMTCWLRGGDVTLTDLPSALPHTNMCLQDNLQRLGGDECLPTMIRTAEYTWGGDHSHLNAPYDVLIGSDIIYQPEFIPDLISSFTHLGNKHTTIIIAYKPRGLGEDIFLKSLSKQGYHVEAIGIETYPKDFVHSEYSIFHITYS